MQANSLDYQDIISKLRFVKGSDTEYTLDSLVCALGIYMDQQHINSVRNEIEKIKGAIGILGGLGYRVIFRYQHATSWHDWSDCREWRSLSDNIMVALVLEHKT